VGFAVSLASMTKRQKIFARVGQAAGVLLVLIVFWFGAEQNNVTGWRTEPNPEVGRTIPAHVKGGTIYVSKSDLDLDRWLSFTAYGAGVVMLICLIFSGELRRLINLGRKPPLSG
jgi:hypothetical protein